MKLIKKTISNIPFDLHDSRIVKMECWGLKWSVSLQQELLLTANRKMLQPH